MWGRYISLGKGNKIDSYGQMGDSRTEGSSGAGTVKRGTREGIQGDTAKIRGYLSSIEM